MQRTILHIALWAAVVAAQPQGQPIFSPVVNADRTVTFHLRAPNAVKVEVAMENGK